MRDLFSLLHKKKNIFNYHLNNDSKLKNPLFVVSFYFYKVPKEP